MVVSFNYKYNDVFFSCDSSFGSSY